MSETKARNSTGTITRRQGLLLASLVIVVIGLLTVGLFFVWPITPSPKLGTNEFLSEAKRVCGKALESSAEDELMPPPGALGARSTFSLLAIQGTFLGNRRLMVEVPFLEPETPEQLRALACIGTYQTAEGWEVWRVRVVRWPSGRVLGRANFASRGSKTPLKEVEAWMVRAMGDKSVLYQGDSGDGRAAHVFFGADGNTLVVGDHHWLKLWDVPSGKFLHTYNLDTVGGAVSNWTDFKLAMALSPDGKLLAHNGLGRVRLWDVANGQELGVLPTDGENLAFAPGGNILATGYSQAVELWDVAKRERIQKLRPSSSSPSSLAFSTDGKTLAVGFRDFSREAVGATVELWDAAAGKQIGILRGHRFEVNGLAFSRDGRLLVSASAGAVKFWDTGTWKELRTLDFQDSDGGAHKIEAIALSSDSRLLATSLGPEIILWDVATGQKVRTLQGHTKAVHALAFAVDGKTLASTSDDGTAKLWDVASGQ